MVEIKCEKLMLVNSFTFTLCNIIFAKKNMLFKIQVFIQIKKINVFDMYDEQSISKKSTTLKIKPFLVHFFINIKLLNCYLKKKSSKVYTRTF